MKKLLNLAICLCIGIVIAALFCATIVIITVVIEQSLAPRKEPDVFWVEQDVAHMESWWALKMIPTTNGLCEIGFRSDGVVVWRKTP